MQYKEKLHELIRGSYCMYSRLNPVENNRQQGYRTSEAGSRTGLTTHFQLLTAILFHFKYRSIHLIPARLDRFNMRFMQSDLTYVLVQRIRQINLIYPT